MKNHENLQNQSNLSNTDSFGNFNLFDKILTKVANKQNTTHRFSTEWRVFIIIALIVGLATSLVSIYSGNHFLRGYLSSFSNSPLIVTILTFTALLIIEFLTYYAMSKAFKFGLKMDVLKFLPTTIFTIAIYTLSFYQSTSGLSIQESSKVDKSELINDNLSIEIDNLKADLKANIAYYKGEVANIKSNPQGYSKSGGSRSVLKANQLSDIKAYNNTISELKQDVRAEIKQLEKDAKQDKANNLTEITSTREKYFGFISVIMAIQVLCSGFLGFAWSQIQSENAPQDYAKSKVLDITMQVDSSINALWQSRLNSLQHGLDIALNSNSAAGTPLEIQQAANIATADKEESEVVEAEILNKTDKGNYSKDAKIGFQMNAKKTPTAKPKNDTDTGTQAKQRICEHCKTPYTYKIHNQKFCCTQCRKDAWELKTGAKLNYSAKK